MKKLTLLFSICFFFSQQKINAVKIGTQAISGKTIVKTIEFAWALGLIAIPLIKHYWYDGAMQKDLKKVKETLHRVHEQVEKNGDQLDDIDEGLKDVQEQLKKMQLNQEDINESVENLKKGQQQTHTMVDEVKETVTQIHEEQIRQEKIFTIKIDTAEACLHEAINKMATSIDSRYEMLVKKEQEQFNGLKELLKKLQEEEKTERQDNNQQNRKRYEKLLACYSKLEPLLSEKEQVKKEVIIIKEQLEEIKMFSRDLERLREENNSFQSEIIGELSEIRKLIASLRVKTK